MSSKGETSRQILRETLVLATSSFITASAVERLVAYVDSDSIEQRIYFLQAYKEFVRDIPDKIYPSLENRAKLLDAIQECLDNLIQQEEE